MNINNKEESNQIEQKKLKRKFVRLKSISDHFKCAVCSEVFEIPTRLYCGHVFCQKCITQWRSSSNTCPHCRKEIQQEHMQIDILAQSIINEYEVFCVFDECPWKDRLENLETHVNKCKYKEIAIPKYLQQQIRENSQVGQSKKAANEYQDEYLQERYNEEIPMASLFGRVVNKMDENNSYLTPQVEKTQKNKRLGQLSDMFNDQFLKSLLKGIDQQDNIVPQLRSNISESQMTVQQSHNKNNNAPNERNHQQQQLIGSNRSAQLFPIQLLNSNDLPKNSNSNIKHNVSNFEYIQKQRPKNINIVNFDNNQNNDDINQININQDPNELQNFQLQQIQYLQNSADQEISQLLAGMTQEEILLNLNMPK